VAPNPLTARLNPRLARVRYALPRSAECVALTFDDGPDPVYTPAVLDVLHDLHAPGTFFLVGARAEAYPDLVRRIIGEGHAVGSHTYTHVCLDSSPSRMVHADVERGRRAVEEAAERPVACFRPPRGRFGARGAYLMRRLGLRPWLWSVDTQDWRPDATAEGISAAAGRLEPGDVVLLHDSLADADASPAAIDRSQTIAALPHIVEGMRRKGLQPVRLPG
jgi:peptidoglycan/xylan/chitin deacetylase (PgdA/CDA1 family)